MVVVMATWASRLIDDIKPLVMLGLDLVSPSLGAQFHVSHRQNTFHNTSLGKRNFKYGSHTIELRKHKSQ